METQVSELEKSDSNRPDPDLISTRSDLGAALSSLRLSAGFSVRALTESTSGSLGTISGWLSGVHAPTGAHRDLFNRVLQTCGVADSELDDWWSAVVRARVRTRVKPTAIPNAVPYRGFEAYQIGDAPQFFGRDLESSYLLERIYSITASDEPATPLIVIGGSGVGKSSVVRAGLAHALAESAGEDVDHVVITPGLDPNEALDEALATLVARGAKRRLLVVDQFEEVWTQHDGGTEIASDVTSRLLSLAAEPGPVRTVVVLVLRSDFLDRLLTQPGYTRAARKGTVVVGPIDQDGIRAAIVGPAEKAGAVVEPGLVELLLSDAANSGDAAGVLPLLSHALLSTWQRSNGRVLSVATYFDVGRLTGAVEQTAEAVYTDLDSDGRESMRRLLLSLINVGETDIARHIASKADLGLTEAGSEQTAQVLSRLVDARLVTSGDDGVQLSHEALVEAWPRLAGWVDADRGRLRLEHRIRTMANLWSQSGEPEGMLLSSGVLDLIDSQAAGATAIGRGALERRMITESAERRDRRAADSRRQVHKLRAVAGAALIFAVVAALAATVAGIGLANTATARDEASTAHAASTSRQLALESRRLRPRDSALAAQLAVAAYRISPTIEARSNLLDTSTDPPASRRVLGTPFNIATDPSGSFAALRLPNRLEIYEVGERGLGAMLGAADFDAGAAAGSGLSFVGGADTVLLGTGRGVLEFDVRDKAAPRMTSAAPTNQTVTRIAASNDGATVLAALASAAPVIFQRADNWRPVSVPSLPSDYDDASAGIGLSADGRLAAVSAPDRGIALWDLTGAEPVAKGVLALDGSTNQAGLMAFHGATLAAGLHDKQAILIDVSNPDLPAITRRIGNFTSYVNDVQFIDDGKRLTAAGSDGQVRVVSLTDPTPDLVFRGPDPVGHTAVGRDTVFASSEGGVMRSWPIRTGEVSMGALSVFQAPVAGRDLLVANGGPGSAVGQWELRAGPSLVRHGPDIEPPDGVKFSGALAFSTNGPIGALGTIDGRIFLVDLKDPGRPALSSGGAQALASLIDALTLSSDGQRALASGGSSPRVAFVDTSNVMSPRLIGTIDVGTGVLGVGFLSQDRVVIGTDHSELLVVDVQNPAAPTVLSRTAVFDQLPIGGLAVAPDGATVLLSTSGGSQAALVRIGGRGSEPSVTRFTGPSGGSYGVAFSPDGARFVAASTSGEARLYRLAGLAAPVREATLSIDDVTLFDGRFTADGSMLIASGSQGLVRAWMLDPGAVIDEVCASGSAPITEEEWERLVPSEPYQAPCP